MNRYGSRYILITCSTRNAGIRCPKPSVEARHGFRYQFPSVTRSTWQLWYNFRGRAIAADWRAAEVQPVPRLGIGPHDSDLQRSCRTRRRLEGKETGGHPVVEKAARHLQTASKARRGEINLTLQKVLSYFTVCRYRLILGQPRLTKETAVVTTQSFMRALALVFSLNLSGCTDARLEQSIALCTEAMEINASQLHWNDEQKQKVMKQACAQGGGGRTPEQWQCVITAMKQSESYVKATDTCFAR